MLTKRFLLISIIPGDLTTSDTLKDLRELKSLIEAYGGIVTELITQRREVHDKGSYIGSGKINEALSVIKLKKIDVVVLNGVIKPGHLYDMKNIFLKSNRNIEVWDRIDLILQIFAKHANTKEAKLQIELAAMRHMGPRIYGMGMELSRQTGGIGTRGIGETNTELMKRHWHTRMKIAQDKLDKLASARIKQQNNRIRKGVITVSLVGYTNAGKTSLFNLLTRKNKRVEDALFVTLDSVTGNVYLPNLKKEILLSDTIGFIKNLPVGLIDAFKSTLIESIYSDLLLHVIDINDEDFPAKIKVVDNLLKDLKIDNKRKIYVFNKIDGNKNLIRKTRDLMNTVPVCFVSAKTGFGRDTLLKYIEKYLIRGKQSNYKLSVSTLGIE